MNIQYRDSKSGAVKLRTGNLDDLWYLSQIIQAGDLVRAKTQRRIKDREDTKSSGGQRKTITLTLRVENTQFKSDTDSLRISGTIESGPEDLISIGSHHTINVDIDTQLTIIKDRWTRTEYEILDDAVKGTLRPKVIIVSVDDGEACMALIRESKTEYSEISENIGGKYDTSGRDGRVKGFYERVTQALENTSGRENVQAIILSGPGFEKNNYHDFLRQKNPGLSKKTVVEDTGMNGRAGVREVINRDTLHKSLTRLTQARDERLMEDILAQIGKDTGLAAYGIMEIQKAADMGAVETLLVTDRIFSDERQTIEPIMNSVRKNNGKPHIINQETQAGAKLAAIGEAAAKLRYRII
jgi:protein pelota